MSVYLDTSKYVTTMPTHITVIPKVLSIAPLHLLGHNNQNGVKYDFDSHVMPLVGNNVAVM